MMTLFFIFLCSTLISQSLMDAASLIILIISLVDLVKGKVKFPFIPSSISAFNFVSNITSSDSSSNSFFFEIFFLFWVSFIGFGLWGSEHLLQNWSEWKWIFNLYSIYWFTQNLDFSKSFNTRFFLPLTVVLLICFLYGALSLLLGNDLFKQTPLTHPHRFSGPFDDPMNFAHIYGMYFSFYSAYLLFIFSKKESLNHHILFLVTWFLTGLSVLLSFTRGAWIGVFTACFVMTLLVNKKLAAKLVGFFIFFFTVLFSTWVSFRERILQAFNASENYDSERLALWKTNWLIFKDHIFSGVGYGEYKKWLPLYFEKLGYPSTQFQSHAHNQYLQSLANTGAVGFGFYMIFICLLMRLTWKLFKKNSHPLLLGSLGAQISFHVGSFTECNFERAKVRLVFLIFCAIPLAFFHHRNDNHYDSFP